MYITFCGMSLAGKQQYQDISVEYVIQKKRVKEDNILIVADPKSTDLGRAIVPLDREKQHFNDTVSGLLYIAASCNVYTNLISRALATNKYIFCKGSFLEVLGYQGAVLGDEGISWEMLKNIYYQTLNTCHDTKLIKYPNIVFFCISSFEQAQARAKCYNSTSWEVSLSKREYEKYSSKMREAYKIIAQDPEVTKNSKVLLIDGTNSTLYDVWTSQVKPEIDSLLG